MKPKILLISALLLSPTLQASPLNDKLQDCRSIEANDARLACYDRLVGQMSRAKAGPQPSASTQSNGHSLTESRPDKKRSQAKAEFGLSEAQKETVKVDRIDAVIQSKQKGPRGKWIITLDNGQVWQQKDSDYFLFPKDGAIYIKEGAFGAYYLSAESTNRTIKVKRLQ